MAGLKRRRTCSLTAARSYRLPTPASRRRSGNGSDPLGAVRSWCGRFPPQQVVDVDVQQYPSPLIAGIPTTGGSRGTWVLFLAWRFHARQVQRGRQGARRSRCRSPQWRSTHVALESNGEIQVFDVWNSQEEFDAFGSTLLPILAAHGVELKEPMVARVHNVIEG